MSALFVFHDTIQGVWGDINVDLLSAPPYLVISNTNIS